MFLLRLMVFMLCVCAVAHCSARHPEVNQQTESIQRFYTVTANNPTLTIHLPAQAGTGYQWFLQEYPVTLINILDHKIIPNSTPGMVGGATETLWTLHFTPECFITPQKIRLKFVHSSAWENKEAVIPLILTIVTSP